MIIAEYIWLDANMIGTFLTNFIQTKCFGQACHRAVEDFAFVPIGSAPNGRRRINFGGLTTDATLHTQAVIVSAGLHVELVQMVNDFEARFGRQLVDGGNATKSNVAFVFAQMLQKLNDAAGVGDALGCGEHDLAVLH